MKRLILQNISYFQTHAFVFKKLQYKTTSQIVQHICVPRTKVNRAPLEKARIPSTTYLA